MRSILISVSLEQAQNILNGSQTLLLRKSVPKDFVGWVYMCVTKRKPYLTATKWNSYNMQTNEKQSGIRYELFNFLDFKYQSLYPHISVLNGLVVARWWHDEYTKLVYQNGQGFSDDEYVIIDNEHEARLLWQDTDFIKKTCLEDEVEISNYGNGKPIYAWHIKKLEIFDKPMELGGFYTKFKDGEIIIHNLLNKTINGIWYKPLDRARQSWQYVWVKE
jgi:hypothetical protein